MKINHYSSILAATCILSFSSAGAAIFDFAAIADGDDSYGLMGGEQGAASLTFTKDGLSVIATGFNGINNDNYFAYLDADYAGLGVCQNITDADQCTPSSDDNVTFEETLKLVFNQKVTIASTTFVNGNHNTNFDGNFKLTIDGATETYSLINIFEMDLTGTTFEFHNPNSGGDSDVSNTKQFYINALDVSAVPVPATVWLFGSGLIGLVGIARRRVA